MVGAYTALPPAVAATVPRRIPLRDSWIRQQSSITSEPPSVSVTSSPASTPPMTPRSPRASKLGLIRHHFDTPRPASVVVTTYTPPREGHGELHGISGKVSRAKAFFESAPLQAQEKPPQAKEEPLDTIVSYRVKNPYRVSPRPKPRRFRNTVSTFPRWVSNEDPNSNDDDDSDSEPQVIITNVTSSASSSPSSQSQSPSASSSTVSNEIELNPPIEITRIKPSFIRRRYGTVTGLITDRSSIEEALQKRLALERELHASFLANEDPPKEQDDDVVEDAATAADAATIATLAAAATTTTTGGAGVVDGSPGSDEIHKATRVAEEVSAVENTEEFSTGRDGAWNRRTIAAPSHSPPPSCRCDHATVVCDTDARRSECQGSAAEGHASSKTIMVVPEDGQVQAAAPRVVAACIKSYHDIPEELFNSLQESSVDPHPPNTPSSPPPPPPPSSPPPSTKTNNTQHAPVSPPTPAPRSDWKTMREGRKALLMGEVSDAETEEGSEVDLGGVASTSDYHTSDGRGSSLSGASDDHHRHDNHHHHHHQKNDFTFNHHHHLHQNNNSINDYHQNMQDADEEAEFECYNPEVSAPTVIIRNNFRGFCSTMLGTPSIPSSHEYLPPSRPPPPPRFSSGSRSPTPPPNDRRPNSAASLLEEELRAAGIYFRRPGSPPRIPYRSRTLSPTPPPKPSSSRLERNSIGEAEAVAAALHVLDASLAGLSDSSGESSPARSHASTVVERRQCSLDPVSVDITHNIPVSHPTPSSPTTSRHYGHSSSSSSSPVRRDHSDSPDSVSVPSVPLYSDLNDSDTSSAVDYTYESGLSSTCSADDSIRFSGVEDLTENHDLGVKSGGDIGRGECERASTNTVGGTGEDGGPCQAPHHHHHQHQQQHQPSSKETNVMESLNLIEEVYVDTRPIPRTTVSMRAYYPGIHYGASSSSSSSSPKSTLKPPSVSRHPERGASLDSTQTLPADSDSGHESGATSPCGTLILDDTQSPPPSPPNNHNTLKTQSTSVHAHTSSISHSRTSSLQSCMGPGVLEGEVGVAVVGDPNNVDVGMGRMALEPRPPTHFVVVAIDFGTTYSGYAFSFTRDSDSIHMMKKWEGGDPGVQNQKTPTIVLLTPEEEFHSLGFIARDTYHDLEPKEAKKWLYFDKFKMALHADQTLSRDTLLEAANGRKIPALKIFSYALKYFRDHALKELSDQAGVDVLEEDIRWVITVPAIWSHPAKQFMRTAAYQAGMGSTVRPDQLLIALEPEAAAIYCRRLRRHQLLPERPSDLRPVRHSALKETTPPPDSPSVPALPELDREELVSLPYRSVETVADWLKEDTVYAVVDCGGGTVDITVHQMTDKSTGHLKELHKATGGPHGSTGVDGEFEHLLETIFGADFLQTFRQQRPAAYVDLMIAFESRKRNASPYRSNPLNIALPFSFIDLFRKFRGKDVEWAMKKHQTLGVKWSAQGMLRVEQDTMRQLFLPTLSSITQAIEAVLSAPEVGHLQYMFLVGGFAESELLQKHIRDIFGHRVNVIIPQGMGLAILRGAVQFGLDPGVVTVRRSRLTYGVGVLNRYQRGLHPPDKRVVAAGSEWCADVLDRFVAVDESVAIGDVVIRPYTPATPGQSTVILHLYATDRHDAKFVTEDGVQRVGTLHLELGIPIQDNAGSSQSGRREITVHMKFGDTEVKASAVDHLTGQIVRANIDFLTL